MGYLGEVLREAVLHVTDVLEHGHTVFIIEWRIAGDHLIDQHTHGPPADTRN